MAYMNGYLLRAPLIVVGSVLWAPIWYVVYSWYVLGRPYQWRMGKQLGRNTTQP